MNSELLNDAGIDSRSPIPVAPLGAGRGSGHYPAHGTGALVADLRIVERMLSTPLWPVSAETRLACVNWLASVIETCGDERAKSRAALALIAADKLNLEVARLTILEEQLRTKRPPIADNVGAVTIILEAADGTQTLMK